MPLNPSNNYATPYHEYLVMYRKEGMNHLYILSMDPRSLLVFHLVDLLVLERYFLNSLFFINSKKGTWIFIFWISFSKLKEEEDFEISLVSGVGFLIRTCGI
jgi:hypothetical protein